jgi:mannose-6-phosphate isomerase-like protein (cupin superfamily)
LLSTVTIGPKETGTIAGKIVISFEHHNLHVYTVFYILKGILVIIKYYAWRWALLSTVTIGPKETGTIAGKIDISFEHHNLHVYTVFYILKGSLVIIKYYAWRWALVFNE